jgi:hypothetical protein
VAAFLVILGNRDGLRWVLRNERMAFRGRGVQAAAAIDEGDDLLLYTTRGCFGNPGSDLGRVIGLARATSTACAFDGPIKIAGRDFSSFCEIQLISLAERGEGVALTDHLIDLTVFPDRASWSAWMRRPLLALPTTDARLLLRALSPLAGPSERVLDGYL